MANNPFDPQLVQIRKTLSRGGLGTVNRGFGSLKTAPTRTRQAPAPEPAEWWPENLSELNDVDVTTTPPTHNQLLSWNSGTEKWEPRTVSGGGGGGGGADRRWTVGSTETSIDEFNDDSLDPAWVRVDGTGALSTSLDWIEGADVLSAQHTSTADSSNVLHAILQSLSGIGGSMVVGDAFVTAFTTYGDPDANYTMGGLILSTSAVFGSGTQVFNLHYNGTSSGKSSSDLRATNGFNSAVGSTVGARETPGSGSLRYTRLVMVTSTTWRVDSSPDGIGWIPGPANITWANVPTHVGFLSSNWGQAVPSVVSYEFIRRVSGIS